MGKAARKLDKSDIDLAKGSLKALFPRDRLSKSAVIFLFCLAIERFGLVDKPIYESVKKKDLPALGRHMEEVLELLSLKLGVSEAVDRGFYEGLDTNSLFLKEEYLEVFETMEGLRVLEFLVDVSGALFDEAHMSKEGVYYTPWAIADDMVSGCLKELGPEDASKLKVLDPACGSGVFLLAAFFRLKPARSELLGNLGVIAGTLFGVDKDSWARNSTVLALFLAAVINSHDKIKSWLTLPQVKFSSNVVVANSLLDRNALDWVDSADNKLLEEYKPISWKSAFPDVFEKSCPGFDLIVGNPPYGLARGEKLSAWENQQLKQQYAKYKFGKVNKYLAFMAKGFELLAEGGVLSLLVPNAWLGVKSGEWLRKFWIERGMLKAVDCYGESIFTQLGLEVVSFVVKKERKHNGEITIRHKNFLATKLEFGVGAQDCLGTPGSVVPLRANIQVLDVLRHIDKHSCCMSSPESLFTPYIALQAYLVGKGDPPQTPEDVKGRVFDCDTKLDKHTYPYLNGRDVCAFRLMPSKSSFLRYGKFLAEPQSLDRFIGPRVVVREVISGKHCYLDACYLEETVLYNKSVLNIRPRFDSVTSLECKALAAILNSTLAAFVISQRGRKSQRKVFRKLVNDDLKAFPLPVTFSQIAEVLAKLYDKVSCALLEDAGYKYGWREGLESSDCLPGVLEELDHAVFDAYSIGVRNREIIKESIRV